MLSHAENKSLLSEDAFIPVSALKIEDNLLAQSYPDEKVSETVEAWIVNIIKQIAAEYCSNHNIQSKAQCENEFLLYACNHGWTSSDSKNIPALNGLVQCLPLEAFTFLEEAYLEKFTQCEITDTIIDSLTSHMSEHSEIQPEELKGGTTLEEMRKSNLHISSELFQCYYHKREMDFSNCILEYIDFSKYEILSDAKFTNAKLTNVTITPQQYLNCFHHSGAIFENIKGTPITETMMQNASGQAKGVWLFYAIITRQKQFIPVLIQAGAEISTSQNSEIDSALAKRLSKLDIYAITANVAQTQDLKDFYGLILCHVAKKNNQFIGEMLALLNAGASPVILDSQGMTAIELAAKGCRMVFVFLLASRLDRNNLEHSIHLFKALLILLSADQISICVILINHIEMDLNFRMSIPYKNTDEIVVGTTIMHHAARLGHTEVVKALLDKGADALIQDAKYYTPLNRAIECRKWTVADVIMVNRVDSICLKSRYLAGSSLSAIILSEQIGLAEKIIDLYGKNILDFQYTIEINHEFYQFTPLHCAAYIGSLPLIDKLLALGADINIRTGLNKKAEEVAVQNGHWDCAYRLKKHDKTRDSVEREFRVGGIQHLNLEQVLYENKFQNQDSLDDTTKALFKNLEEALNTYGTEAPAKRVIFDHFNLILRDANQPSQRPVDIHKAIYTSQEKLISKLSHTPSRLTTHVLDKLADLFILAGVFCGGGLAGTLAFQGLTAMSCIVPIIAPIYLLTMVGYFSVTKYSMFRTNRYTEKADEANALQPLANLFFHVSRK